MAVAWLTTQFAFVGCAGEIDFERKRQADGAAVPMNCHSSEHAHWPEGSQKERKEAKEPLKPRSPSTGLSIHVAPFLGLR